MNYREDNPAFRESRTPADVLKTFTLAERKAFYLMTPKEVEYLRKECFISKYITHLRKGEARKAVGSDLPVPVVKGTKLQLERYKVLFLMSLIDYNGVKYFYPTDFSLENASLMREMANFSGVVVIKIAKGSATSTGLDEHRSELISGVLVARRDMFNPTLVLTEENISGKLNVSSDLIKVITLDKDKLRGSYNGEEVDMDTTIASRKKEVQPTFNKPVAPTYSAPATGYNKPSYTSNYSRSYGKKEKPLSATEMRELALQQRRESEN